jgi:hypothetical protein
MLPKNFELFVFLSTLNVPDECYWVYLMNVIERTWWMLLSVPDECYWAYLMNVIERTWWMLLSVPEGCYWAYLMNVIERTWWMLLSVPDECYWTYLMNVIERTWWMLFQTCVVCTKLDINLTNLLLIIKFFLSSFQQFFKNIVYRPYVKIKTKSYNALTYEIPRQWASVCISYM